MVMFCNLNITLGETLLSQREAGVLFYNPNISSGIVFSNNMKQSWNLTAQRETEGGILQPLQGVIFY
jgi:hypothetical protein